MAWGGGSGTFEEWEADAPRTDVPHLLAFLRRPGERRNARRKL